MYLYILCRDCDICIYLYIYIYIYTHIFIHILLLSGFGAGLISLNSFISTGPYFDKKKGIALGITTAGSGLGALVVPHILRALFDEMDFSSALLLYGKYLR